jgi:hypothetical protein
MLKDDRESHSLHLKTVCRCCHRKSPRICLKKDVPWLSLERIEIQATFFGGGRGGGVVKRTDNQHLYLRTIYCLVAISCLLLYRQVANGGGSLFFLLSFFGSTPFAHTSWDRQALSAIQRVERVRKKTIGLNHTDRDGGEGGRKGVLETNTTA